MHSPDCGTHVLTPLESIVQLDWHWYPPLMAPLDESVHPVKLLPVVEYEKLPLLCALPRAGVCTTTAKIKYNFFMRDSSVTQIPRLRGLSRWAANLGTRVCLCLVANGTVLGQ